MTSEFMIEGWSASGPNVALRYRCGEFSFSEDIHFPSDVVATGEVARLLDLLSIVAGVSYAKAFAPATVSFPQLDVSPAGHRLVTLTYDNGMREFAFHNNLPLTSTFVIKDDARGENFQIEAARSRPEAPLIPFGAGRDSCVVARALAHLTPTLFTVGANPYAEQVAHQLSLPLLTATRTLDPQLLKLNEVGAPNGHIPVTAINSLISLITAETTGHTSVVMANEKSASRPTRVVNDVEVNHQFSKSYEYERALQLAVDSAGSFVRYTSVLRNASDASISRAFASKCTDLHHLFMSCNQAMLRNESRRSNGWCCNCPKCRGMFLSIAPFMTPHAMADIFGRDLLADDSQLSGFRDLMSDDTKPFECVADAGEARHSMQQLLAIPEWSHHSVVQASRDLASQPTDSEPDQLENWIPTFFDDELAHFLGTRS